MTGQMTNGESVPGSIRRRLTYGAGPGERAGTEQGDVMPKNDEQKKDTGKRPEKKELRKGFTTGTCAAAAAKAAVRSLLGGAREKTVSLMTPGGLEAVFEVWWAGRDSKAERERKRAGRRTRPGKTGAQKGETGAQKGNLRSEKGCRGRSRCDRRGSGICSRLDARRKICA